MKQPASLIDFTELVSPVPGEGLEQLTRRIGEKKGLRPHWAGRGPDSGRDLFFTEIRVGPLASTKIKWLVSCKDRSGSGNSVKEGDLPPSGVKDKLAQHRADGFLLVTTTTVSAAAKSLLDDLDKRNGGDIHTLVWDSVDLTAALLDPDNQEILSQFLPTSYQRVRGLTSLEGAILAFAEQLPDKVLAKVLRLVAPYCESPRVGLDVWPYDSASAAAIDRIVKDVLSEGDLEEAISATEEIEFDAFMALVEWLHDHHPVECYEYLSALVCEYQEPNVQFNAVQFLFDHYEVPAADQMRFATRLDPGTLNELYTWEIASFVERELLINSVDYELYQSIDVLSSATQLVRVSVRDLEFRPMEDQRIEFSGHMRVEVVLFFEREDMGRQLFPGAFRGFFNEHGMFLKSATVDITAFYE